MFSCMCERLRDDALLELRAAKQAASDPIDSHYLGSRSITSTIRGGIGGDSGAFGSGAAADGWLDHQPGPPDAASAAEILRRTERASAINRSERPSENVFNEVGSMEGGISAGTTEADTIAPSSPI